LLLAKTYCFDPSRTNSEWIGRADARGRRDALKTIDDILGA
jgi:hypothetical protein